MAGEGNASGDQPVITVSEVNEDEDDPAVVRTPEQTEMVRFEDDCSDPFSPEIKLKSEKCLTKVDVA